MKANTSKYHFFLSPYQIPHETNIKRKNRSHCTSREHKWSRFWSTARFNSEINSGCCFYYKKWKPWCLCFHHHCTSWSFQGKSKWDKWLLIKILLGKKYLFSWSLENSLWNSTSEWKKIAFKQESCSCFTKHRVQVFIKNL